MPLALTQLLSPMPVAAFLSEIWPNTPRRFDGPIERLEGLRDLSALTLEQLVEARRKVQVFTPFSTTVDAETGLRHHEAGNTIEVGVPTLATEFLGQLAIELGVPRDTVSATMFCTPKDGTALSPHWDGWEQFIVQLRGRKRWRLAAPTVQWPAQGYVEGSSPDPQLERAADGRPFEMGTPTDDLELREGSVLFLPRGTWHHVLPVGVESWHLSIYVRTPSVADALYRAMLRTPDARFRRPLRVTAKGASEELASALSLLSALPQAVDARTLRELFATGGTYLWTAGTRAIRADGGALTVTLAGSDEELELELDEEGAEHVARWMVARDAFTSDELFVEGGGSLTTRDTMVRLLTEAGALRFQRGDRSDD